MLTTRITATIVTSLIALGGCGTGAGGGNPYEGGGDQPRLAAYAARAQYPTTRPSDGLQATALVNRDEKTIRIINASDRPIRDANVWVNGSFVRHVGTVPANSTLALDRRQFYNRDGQTLASMNVSVNRVQVENDGGFFDLQGPVSE